MGLSTCALMMDRDRVFQFRRAMDDSGRRAIPTADPPSRHAAEISR